MKHREVIILVEFKGEVSPENRRLLVRRNATRMGLTSLLCLLPLELITAFVLILGDGWENWGWFLVFGTGISLLGSILVFALSFTKHEQKSLFPTRAVFYGDRDESVLFECPKRRLELYREDIRRVVDMGDYYYLDIPSQNGQGMVCQKNLLTVGTEETFEELFEGKIERGEK